jgi:Zn-dependent metalloprotease
MHRHSIFCIIPPVVFERIARNGSPKQREIAIDTLSRDHSLRAARLQNTILRGDGSLHADALAVADPGKPKRTIFDAKGTETLPGEPVVHEGEAPKSDDPAIREAYDGLGQTYDYYWTVHDRDSIDDSGMPLLGVVHYGQRYDNAFWDGQRMIFGDGDGELFNRFTISLDVIGHELTHGVTEDEAGLNYWQQSGALNESVSDVFGSLIKQHKLGQTAEEADWLIGEGLLAEAVEGKALRSMAEPGTAYDDDVLGRDPQPAHMDDYVQTTSDNGGVHINSGIPNHAFYLLAMELGGHAWEKAGGIWYSALRDPRLQPTARFSTFARTTARAARRLYGDDSEEAQAVAHAWDQVGVPISQEALVAAGHR